MKIPPSSMAQAWPLLALLPLLVLASEETGERKETSLTVRQCLTIVDKVQEGGKYSEESIAQICNEEAQSQKCEFFAEALSLASGHTDFEGKHFCRDITEAHFCSETLDHLLASDPVSDLAYGACMRARPAKGDTYCSKFKRMLSQAVNSTDLDTMRACYMMEAYAEGSSKEGAPDEGGATKAAADSEKPATAAASSQAQIVSQSQPLDNFGDGKGRGHSGHTPTIIAKPITDCNDTSAATNLVAKAAVVPTSAKSAVAVTSPPIVPVAAISKDAPAPAAVSKVQTGVEALASKAVLVVPLEKLPEIAAAISKQVTDGPPKKPQQVLLASNVPAQKHVQAQDSNATSPKLAPVPSKSAGAANTTKAAAPAVAAQAAGSSGPVRPAQSLKVNASDGRHLTLAGKPSAESSSVNKATSSKRTNQSATASLIKVHKAEQEKPALLAKLNGTSVTGRNRTAPSLINLTEGKHGIVKKVIPLTPLRGQLDLKAKEKVAPVGKAKAKAGLVTKSVSTAAARKASGSAEAEAGTSKAQRSGETTKDKKKDPYEGFLSKFIA
jgi:hypothetical protein